MDYLNLIFLAEASACSSWQSCPGFPDGTILCAARGKLQHCRGFFLPHYCLARWIMDTKTTHANLCLFQILHTFGGYEPYPGFHDKVSKLIEEARKEWEDKKSKKSSWDMRELTAPNCWGLPARDNLLIGWIYCKDGYRILMLFMLYKMMCAMLSDVFIYIIMVTKPR
jgi:hypothetical protein